MRCNTNNTFLGLGGSLKHVIGEIGTSDISQPLSHVEHSYSNAPTIIRALLYAIDKDTVRNDGESGSELKLVEDVTTHMEGPIQKFEFLAKRLMSDHRHTMAILLGSPIYVSLAE